MASEQVIRETLSITHTNITAADTKLSAEFNRVAFMALMQAESYIMYGPEDARLRVVAAMLPFAGKLSTLSNDQELAEHRSKLETVFQSMTRVQESVPLVTADAILDEATRQPLPENRALSEAMVRRTED